jgi:L-seryl-tRNA(Ser) seleniumtransferase
MSLLSDLGVRPVINADARLTRLGGSLMPAPVRAAMDEAARAYVDMFELQAAVGRRLAELTRNEAALVCTGAAAGLFLAALACMAGDDPARIARLPALDGCPDEVVIHTAHRVPYDLAVRQAGARLVQVGTPAGTRPDELEAAIGPRTAAVLYVAGEHLAGGALPLPAVVAIARARGVPVVVDAAAQLPPPENLWRFTRELGADLAVFSGGKDLAGPQSSGLVVGRAPLVAACAAHAAPHQRLGRPMKVGKEELAGLLAAVELYLRQDHAARIARFEQIVAAWVDALDDGDGVRARRQFPNEAGQPTPRAVVTLDPARCGVSGAELRRRLWEGDPRVAVAAAGEDGISLTPDTLEPGEELIVVERIRSALRG